MHDKEVQRQFPNGTAGLSEKEENVVSQICMADYPSITQDVIACIACFWLWVFAWIGASIPLYMMCCCTSKPHTERPALVPTLLSAAPARQPAKGEGVKHDGTYHALLGEP